MTTRVSNNGTLQVSYPGVTDAWVPAMVLLPSEDGHLARLGGQQEIQLSSIEVAIASVEAMLAGAMGTSVAAINSGLNDPTNGVIAALTSVQAQLEQIRAQAEGNGVVLEAIQTLLSVQETAPPGAPTIYNFMVTSSETEVEIPIPEGTQKVLIKTRGGISDLDSAFKVSWDQGVVASPVTLSGANLVPGFDSVAEGGSYFEEGFYLPSETPIYVASRKAGIVFSLHIWR